MTAAPSPSRTQRPGIVLAAVVLLAAAGSRGVVGGSIRRGDDHHHRGLDMSLSQFWKPETTEDKEVATSVTPPPPQQASSTGSSSLSAEGEGEDEGWNPINVYYGDRSHLEGVGSREYFSQADQDRLVLQLLKDKRNGFFIDLASNDAVQLSNTLALERRNDWTGLCIEPNPRYWYRLAHRKCTVVGALVGKERNQEVMARFDNGPLGGIVDEQFDNKAENEEEGAQVEKRYTVELTSMLRKFDVPRQIDYMSLDVEGAEMFVMQAFPFDTYTISVLTVERPTKELQELFRRNGYVYVKLINNWGESIFVHESAMDEGIRSFADEAPCWPPNTCGASVRRGLAESNPARKADETVEATALVTSGSQRRELETTTDDDDGWSPINVYFGDRSHLPVGNREFFSQAGQDQIVLDLLKNKMNGYFIDLASNDAVQLSNTLALERKNDWTGLCIEPNPRYWYGLAHRRCTVVGTLVGKKNNEEVLARFDNGPLGGIVDEHFDNKDAAEGEKGVQVEKRYTVQLASMFRRFDVPRRIDYMSLDVEGAEMFVMEAFPFDEYTISVLTVERPTKELQELFRRNGYVYVKLINNWGESVFVHESAMDEDIRSFADENPCWPPNTCTAEANLVDVKPVEGSQPAEVGSSTLPLPFRVIQTSPGHTGSTLMLNILQGLLEPNAMLCYMEEIGPNTKDPCPSNIVVKTHHANNVDDDVAWAKRSGATDGVFVVSTNRDGQTIGAEFCNDHDNVLCFEYEMFTYTNDDEMRRAVQTVSSALRSRFAYFEDFQFNEGAAVQRLKEMDELTKQIEDLSFDYYDKKFGIHGGHRKNHAMSHAHEQV